VLPNEIIHTSTAIIIAVGFVLGARAKALKLRQAFGVAVFLLAWSGFSVVRGLANDSWPYWFIDLSGVGGVGGMVAYGVAFAAFFVMLGFVFAVLNLFVRRIVGHGLRCSFNDGRAPTGEVQIRLIGRGELTVMT
jgi:hypothetical protein